VTQVLGPACVGRRCQPALVVRQPLCCINIGVAGRVYFGDIPAGWHSLANAWSELTDCTAHVPVVRLDCMCTKPLVGHVSCSGPTG
jgi:hypothetical protein